jgi:hypothetical protein
MRRIRSNVDIQDIVVVVVIVLEVLQDLPRRPKIFVSRFAVALNGRRHHLRPDVLLNEDDLIFEMVLLAFVLLQSVGSAELNEKHHQNALFGVLRVEDIANYFS